MPAPTVLVSFLSMPSVWLTLVVPVVAALSIFAFCRKSRDACGRLPWKPLSLVLLLTLIFFIGTVRVRVSHPSAEPPDTHLHLAAQQAQMAEKVESIASRLEKQIKTMDIHALMNQSDAPRIVLPHSPKPPDAPAAPAPPDIIVKTTTATAHATPSATIEVDVSERAAGTDQADTELAADEDASHAEAADAPDDAETTPPPPGDPDAAEEHGEPPAAVKNNDPQPAIPSTAGSPPPKRPSWVAEFPKRIGNTQREVVVAGDYHSIDECYRVTDVYLLLTTYDHLMQLLGSPAVTGSNRANRTLHYDDVMANGSAVVADGRAVGSQLMRLAAAGIGIDFIRREIARDEYLETVERSVGPMKKLYTLVEFTPTSDRELLARWHAYQRQERFAVVGAGAASVLGLLGLAWGLLQADTLTKGYYTKRLFLGVPVAIISLVALLALMIS